MCAKWIVLTIIESSFQQSCWKGFEKLLKQQLELNFNGFLRFKTGGKTTQTQKWKVFFIFSRIFALESSENLQSEVFNAFFFDWNALTTSKWTHNEASLIPDAAVLCFDSRSEKKVKIVKPKQNKNYITPPTLSWWAIPVNDWKTSTEKSIPASRTIWSAWLGRS